VPSSTQKLTTKATADSEIQTDLVLTNNDKEQLIERLTMQCNLQKQLIEEQDLLLEQYQSIVNEPEPAVDLGADLEGLLHTVNDQSTAAAIRKQFETFKKRNEISQQLIDEYERLLNGR
jgi:hypothetical protein